MQLPASLRLEPIRFATGLPVDFMAGEALPETGVFICNGAGQTLIRGVIAGTKQTFTVVQRLWRLKTEAGGCWRAVRLAVAVREGPQDTWEVTKRPEL